jgi:hypothetical protein
VLAKKGQDTCDLFIGAQQLNVGDSGLKGPFRVLNLADVAIGSGFKAAIRFQEVLDTQFTSLRQRIAAQV